MDEVSKMPLLDIPGGDVSVQVDRMLTSPLGLDSLFILIGRPKRNR